MELRELYKKIIDAGIKADPRTLSRIKEVLKQEKEALDSLSKEDQAYFDNDKIFNPYADTRVLYGSLKKKINTIMIGIDIDVQEILLADRLNEKGEKIDLILAHHPEGHAYAGFYDVMAMQADIFNKAGVPIVMAEALTGDRLNEVKRSVSSSNHMRSVDGARLLDIPLMCVHTPADNHVVDFLTVLFQKKKPKTVKDIMSVLKTIPEYQEAMGKNAGPFILSGSESARCGKILVDMTGGTEGSRDIFQHLARSGVGTIVAMHLSEAHLKKVKEQKINVINAGHIASDNLGINLLLDKVLRKHAIKIIEVSGFRRFHRQS